MLTPEEMTWIPGHENYKISRCGQVWSRPRLNTKGGFLKQQVVESGYLTLCLGVRHERWYVHTLVAKTFILNPDDLPQVNHKDGDKKNNHVDNLEWVTASENVQHSHDTGLWSIRRGLDSPICKATKEILLVVQNSELSNRQLARQLGVSHFTISYWKKNYVPKLNEME